MYFHLFVAVCVSFYVQISGTSNVKNELIMASFLIKTLIALNISFFLLFVSFFFFKKAVEM